MWTSHSIPIARRSVLANIGFFAWSCSDLLNWKARLSWISPCRITVLCLSLSKEVRSTNYGPVDDNVCDNVCNRSIVPIFHSRSSRMCYPEWCKASSSVDWGDYKIFKIIIGEVGKVKRGYFNISKQFLQTDARRRFATPKRSSTIALSLLQKSLNLWDERDKRVLRMCNGRNCWP